MTTAPKTRTCRACDRPFETEDHRRAYCPRCLVGRSSRGTPLLRASCSVCGIEVVRRAADVLAERWGDHRLACDTCLSQIRAETGARTGARNGAKSGGYNALPSTRDLRDLLARHRSGEDVYDDVISWLDAHTEPGPGTCRDWTGTRTSDGYVSVQVGGRKQKLHRILYNLIAAEPLADGVHAHHVCGRGREGCVSPFCIEPASNAANGLESRERASLRAAVAEARSIYARLLSRPDVRLPDDLRAEIAQALGIGPGVTFGAQRTDAA